MKQTLLDSLISLEYLSKGYNNNNNNKIFKRFYYDNKNK